MAEMTIDAKILAMFGVVATLLVLAALAWRKRVKRSADMAQGWHIGERESQEDAGALVQLAGGTLAVLADGFGKAQAGKLAAWTAVTSMEEVFRAYDSSDNPAYFFQRAFRSSNQAVLERLRGNRGGATAVAAAIYRNKLYYGAVGGVHLAVLRGRQLVSITEGQTARSAARNAFSNGLLSREQANAVTRTPRSMNYIGRDGFKNVEICERPIELQNNDLVVLMTEGVLRGMSWLTLEELLVSARPCQELAGTVMTVLRGSPEAKSNARFLLLRYQEV